MALKIERTDARTWPDEQLTELFSEGFPEFITADRLVKEYIGRVGEWFAGLDLTLVDEHEAPVASGWGVPIHWDGLTETLPTGYTQALVRAVEGREQGTEANTLVICGAVVTPSLKGAGSQERHSELCVRQPRKPAWATSSRRSARRRRPSIR